MMPRYRFVLCLLLASCATPDPNVPPARLTKPGPVSSREVLSVAVAANHDAELRSWVSVYGGCSFRQFVNIWIMVPPRHGTVRLVQGLYKPAYPFPDAREACNQHPSEGIAAVYRPASGYAGLDHIELLAVTPDGTVSTIDVRVIVT